MLHQEKKNVGRSVDNVFASLRKGVLSFTASSLIYDEVSFVEKFKSLNQNPDKMIIFLHPENMWRMWTWSILSALCLLFI